MYHTRQWKLLRPEQTICKVFCHWSVIFCIAYSLTAVCSKDYEFTSPGGQKYVLNVCKHISTEVWSPRVDKPEDVAGYTERAHGGFSLG